MIKGVKNLENCQNREFSIFFDKLKTTRGRKKPRTFFYSFRCLLIKRVAKNKFWYFWLFWRSIYQKMQKRVSRWWKVVIDIWAPPKSTPKLLKIHSMGYLANPCKIPGSIHCTPINSTSKPYIWTLSLTVYVKFQLNKYMNTKIYKKSLL